MSFLLLCKGLQVNPMPQKQRAGCDSFSLLFKSSSPLPLPFHLPSFILISMSKEKSLLYWRLSLSREVMFPSLPGGPSADEDGER